MRAFLYVRVSTQEQAMHGYSIEKQLVDLNKWAVEHGYTVEGIYKDEGVSALKSALKRPQLQLMLQDLEKTDVILFTKLDRWFRNIKEYYKVQEILDAHKVAWRAIYEDYQTETSDGIFKVNIMLSIAQAESQRTSERIKVVKELQREKGMYIDTRHPLGIKRVGHEMAVDEETAHIVKAAFAHYIKTKSINSTTRMLRTEYGIDRGNGHVKELLMNRKYIGELYGKQVCDAIIDRDDFNLVQDLLSERCQRNEGERHIYLFSGLVRCKCGERMVSTSAHPKTVKNGRVYDYDRHYYYYKCRVGCGAGRINEDTLEQWMVDHVLQQYSDYLVTIKPKKKKANNSAIKKKQERLKDLYVGGYIDMETFKADTEKLKIEEEKKPIPKENIKSALALYSELTRQGKKEFWTRIVKTITADDGGYIIAFR